MNQCLRALAAIVEDPSLIPSIGMVDYNHLQLQLRGIWSSFLVSVGTAHMSHTYGHAGKYTHI